jgi:hypothetical protein
VQPKVAPTQAKFIERTDSPTDTSRRCRYQRKDKTLCKAHAQNGSPFCFFHDPALESQRTAARKAGGIARTRSVVLPMNLPTKPLRTVTDVAELLGETINQVRQGEIDLRMSNAIGYLAGILLSAIEKGSLEQRLATLEAVFASGDHTKNDFRENESFDFVQQNPGDPSSAR